MKIGWIDFLNTLPFEFSEENNNFEIVKGLPSEINNLLRNGLIDAGFISSAEYIENFNNYLILPDLSITSYKNVQSVGIFSNKPLEEIEIIHLSTASKTSRFLTKIVFKEFFNRKIKYVNLNNYQNIEEKSVLLIGDNAIKFKDKFKYIYDLSTIWFENTGLPFVFALWGVNKNFYKENPDDVINLYKLLLDKKENFFKNIDEKIKKINLEINTEFAVKYLKNLDYSLESEHIESLKYFSKLLHKHNLIDKIPEFNFIGVKNEVNNK